MTQNFYLLPVQETLSAAWQKTKGAKLTIFTAFVIFTALFILYAISEEFYDETNLTFELTGGIIFKILLTLLQMGLFYIGIQRAKNLPISYKMVFRAFELNMGIKGVVLNIVLFIINFLLMGLVTWSIVVWTENTTPGDIVIPIICAISIVIGFMAYVLAIIRFMLAFAFVIDKNATPLQAIIWSAKATRNNFWRLFLITLIQFIVILISIVPLLGIGLFWSIPFLIILYGEIYNRLLVNI